MRVKDDNLRGRVVDILKSIDPAKSKIDKSE